MIHTSSLSHTHTHTYTLHHLPPQIQPYSPELHTKPSPSPGQLHINSKGPCAPLFHRCTTCCGFIPKDREIARSNVNSSSFLLLSKLSWSLTCKNSTIGYFRMLHEKEWRCWCSQCPCVLQMCEVLFWKPIECLVEVGLGWELLSSPHVNE